MVMILDEQNVVYLTYNVSKASEVLNFLRQNLHKCSIPIKLTAI